MITFSSYSLIPKEYILALKSKSAVTRDAILVAFNKWNKAAGVYNETSKSLAESKRNLLEVIFQAIEKRLHIKCLELESRHFPKKNKDNEETIQYIRTEIDLAKEALLRLDDVWKVAEEKVHEQAKKLAKPFRNLKDTFADIEHYLQELI